MARLIMAVLVLAVLAFAALVGYAYVADLSPATGEVKVPVTLHAD
jgi:predicted small integral membrane protein